ncbi:MAG: hypothetical protein LBL62_08910 [Planctomycetaceae bacterium]|nr:hypothetical protein [Planctomycetaceae bacterium]
MNQYTKKGHRLLESMMSQPTRPFSELFDESPTSFYVLGGRSVRWTVAPVESYSTPTGNAFPLRVNSIT